jgi:predicted kinase
VSGLGVADPGRRVVLVSGAPGAGKSTLAGPLAAGLGFALLGKDRIKETLHDALGAPAPDLAWSRRLGAAAMELLWTLAADAPAVVLEANFRPHSAYERNRILALSARPVEVNCVCPPTRSRRCGRGLGAPAPAARHGQISVTKWNAPIDMRSRV